MKPKAEWYRSRWRPLELTEWVVKYLHEEILDVVPVCMSPSWLCWTLIRWLGLRNHRGWKKMMTLTHAVIWLDSPKRRLQGPVQSRAAPLKNGCSHPHISSAVNCETVLTPPSPWAPAQHSQPCLSHHQHYEALCWPPLIDLCGSVFCVPASMGVCMCMYVRDNRFCKDFQVYWRGQPV